MASRETIFAALYALTSGLTTFKTRSRVLKHWQELDAERCPALFQAQMREQFEQQAGRPAMRRFSAEWYVYIDRGSDEAIVPATELNSCLDALEAALAPAAGEDKQTLGGIVAHAWISGTIETDEGTLGNKAVAIIPIEILVPSDMVEGAWSDGSSTPGAC